MVTRKLAEDPAVGYRFAVKIEQQELGTFTKIAGLGAKYDVLTVKEGGENTFVHSLPGRVSYENLKLTRPVSRDSGKLGAWFTEFQEKLLTASRYEPTTAAITAFGPDNMEAGMWSLTGVVPVSYSGPTFEAGSSKILVETLELAHQGFWR